MEQMQRKHPCPVLLFSIQDILFFKRPFIVAEENIHGITCLSSTPNESVSSPVFPLLLGHLMVSVQPERWW